jgi:RNA polymerase sigma-70 factor, ECF subfamily
LAVTSPEPRKGPVTSDPGEPIELERAFVEHQGRVFRAAYRITGNAHDAEDVLQTVFLRLARQGPGAPSVANLPSYLYRSAVNAALDVLRRRPDDEVPLDAATHGLAGPGSPEKAHEAGEIRERLRRALRRLNPQAAEMFVLRYLEGFDNREIAGMFGGSRMGVAVTLHRARRRLEREFRAMRGGRS